MSHRFALSAAVVLAAALVACRPGPEPEVRIGLLATFSGPYADVSGTPTAHGARLAVEDSGPLLLNGTRHQVILVPRDFEDRADAAASSARALINQERVIALVGPQFSRHAIPVAVLADDARIPMISPMSSSPATTAGHKFVFRLAFLDHVQGAVLAQYAVRDLRARNAAVLYDVSTAYSRELAERFRAAFVSEGGRVVRFESYTADQAADFGPQLARIASGQADVLLLPNFPDALSRQVPQVFRAGIRATLLGSDSWDPQSLPELPPGRQAYVTNQWRPDIPTGEARQFVERYRSAYHGEPRATAAMTYDAVRILLEAIRRAGTTDPDAVRDALAATSGFRGATGTVSFASGNDPQRDVAVSAIRGRALHTMRLVSP